MTPAELRLEALKLAVRPGLELDSIIIAAELYYGFIVKDSKHAPDRMSENNPVRAAAKAPKK